MLSVHCGNGRFKNGKVDSEETIWGPKHFEWRPVRHTDGVNLEVDFKADGLLDSGSAVQSRAAGTTVSVRVARGSLRDSSGSCVGEGRD